MLKLFYGILFTLLISPAYAADMVVIRASDNAGYFAGQLLEQQTPINLAQDAEITVVFASGNILTTSGFQGNLQDPEPNQADKQLVASLANFINRQALDELSVIRNLNQERPSSAWQVDMTNGKRHYCVAEEEQVTLWRPSSTSATAATLEIKHKSSAKRVKTMWPAHKNTLVWPQDLPVIYEDDYNLEVNNLTGQRLFKMLVLHRVPRDLPSKSHQVVWMVGRGCTLQANLLLAGLK